MIFEYQLTMVFHQKMFLLLLLSMVHLLTNSGCTPAFEWTRNLIVLLQESTGLPG